MKPVSKIFLVVLIAVVIGAAGFFCFRTDFFKSSETGPAVEINNHKFFVEIADEPDERSRGLSGRENLCDKGEKGEKVEGEIKGEMGIMGEKGENCGMIFLFDKPGRYGFWMKGMEFPLDFIWIAGDEIVDIDKNIPPDYSGVLKPEIPVDKVLEVNAGVCERYKIEIGDEIKIDLDSR